MTDYPEPTGEDLTAAGPRSRPARPAAGARRRAPWGVVLIGAAGLCIAVFGATSFSKSDGAGRSVAAGAIGVVPAVTPGAAPAPAAPPEAPAPAGPVDPVDPSPAPRTPADPEPSPTDPDTRPTDSGAGTAAHCTYHYRLDEEWDGGFIATATVTNTRPDTVTVREGHMPIHDLSTVSGISGAKLRHDGNRVVLTPDGASSWTLPPQGTITVHFRATTTAKVTRLRGFHLDGTRCEPA
jgi:hypothetical protein